MNCHEYFWVFLWIVCDNLKDLWTRHSFSKFHIKFTYIVSHPRDIISYFSYYDFLSNNVNEAVVVQYPLWKDFHWFSIKYSLTFSFTHFCLRSAECIIFHFVLNFASTTKRANEDYLLLALHDRQLPTQQRIAFFI